MLDGTLVALAVVGLGRVAVFVKVAVPVEKIKTKGVTVMVLVATLGTTNNCPGVI